MDESQRRYAEWKSLSQKNPNYMILFIWNSRTGISIPWWEKNSEESCGHGFCLIWWTPIRNTANFWQKLTKVKGGACGPPCFYGQEADYKFYSCKYILLFHGTGRTTQRTEPRDRSVETRAMNSHSWGRAGQKPKPETANVFLAGFQSCFGPGPPVCFLSLSFLDKRSTRCRYAVSVPPMYVGREGQRDVSL